VRLSKAEEKLRQELVAELAAAGKLVDYRFTELLSLVQHITNDVNEAIRAYNIALVKARVFSEGIAESFRDVFDDKSERWQESDSGQAADSFISEWEEFTPSPLVEVFVLDPELEEKPCHAKALEDLPSESE
jgi:hypothetical protein